MTPHQLRYPLSVLALAVLAACGGSGQDMGASPPEQTSLTTKAPAEAAATTPNAQAGTTATPQQTPPGDEDFRDPISKPHVVAPISEQGVRGDVLVRVLHTSIGTADKPLTLQPVSRIKLPNSLLHLSTVDFFLRAEADVGRTGQARYVVENFVRTHVPNRRGERVEHDRYSFTYGFNPVINNFDRRQGNVYYLTSLHWREARKHGTPHWDQPIQLGAMPPPLGFKGIRVINTRRPYPAGDLDNWELTGEDGVRRAVHLTIENISVPNNSFELCVNTHRSDAAGQKANATALWKLCSVWKVPAGWPEQDSDNLAQGVHLTRHVHVPLRWHRGQEARRHVSVKLRWAGQVEAKP
ncbi:MAG: hypothetical protein Q4D91_06925 [Lautropia sp.]|nr:hypothetical protein [Lautropia sp.]